MSLAPGIRLGAYEIVSLVGAGGMGEVYRARDPRLARDVAVKVLPPAFSADVDRLRRFEQEARAAAALNHPNILAVYDIGAHEGAPYVVSELLEGETLRERLASSPTQSIVTSAAASKGGTPTQITRMVGGLPVRKACDFAIQMARGLAAAHEKGIVHRDLKPENIFVTLDGRIKILDFGLAKLTERDSPLAGATNVPTTPFDLARGTAEKTQAGMVLGTIGYMAPEQVRGQAVDHRADLFAFGALLYEMLSGRRAFHGETTIDTMTAILKEDPPDLPTAERHIPAPLERIVDRCLEKNAAARFQTANDLAFALEGVSATTTDVGAPVVVARGQRVWRDVRLAWAIAAVTVVAAAGAVVIRPAPTAPSQKLTFTIDVPTGQGPLHFAVSPGGRHVVTLAGRERSLWLRSLDRLDGTTLAGTNDTIFPFWSPDGRRIGFFGGGKLKKIDIIGGPPEPIADAPSGAGGSWSSNDVVIFAPQNSGPLFQIPASGGTPVQITDLDKSRDETAHMHPVFLPDGRHFLFLARSPKPENSAIYFASLDTKERRRVIASNVKAAFAPPNHILFVRGNALMAQQIDVRDGALNGDPVQIVEEIGANSTNGSAGMSVSANGTLMHRVGGVLGGRETKLTWFDRGGKPLGIVGAPGIYRNPRLSPDGTRLLVQRLDASTSSGDLWIIDVNRNVPMKFTFARQGEINSAPVWSPDGTRVAWQLGASATVVQNLANGTGKDEKVRDLPRGSVIDEWVGGLGILYHDGSPGAAKAGVQVLPMDGSAPRMLGGAHALLTHTRISPDGNWIAYTSSDEGRPEVYVQNFPALSERVKVSTSGGDQPVWRRDGRELFFFSGDGTLMGVPIDLNSRDPVGAPVTLFSIPVEGAGQAFAGVWHQYDVAPDGKRFLVNTLVQGQQPDSPTQTTTTLTVVVNWAAGLTK